LGNPSYGFGSVDPSAGVDVLKVPDKARENNQASHGTVAGQASERTPAEAGRRQGANAGWVDQALIDFDAAVSALDDALLANLASALVG
ncbi:MAG: hypothetical protein HY000_22620, partial [Planctomycetes bacterium]|nr:hypothetical protein [Planctomycetota bacterium]